MKTERVYISGPVSSVGIEQARRNFWEAAKYLRNLNYKVVNPLNMRLCVWLASHFGRTGYKICLLIELCYMAMRCDVIYMLADWQQSPGAKAEKAMAEALGMPVLFQLSKEEYKRRKRRMTS